MKPTKIDTINWEKLWQQERHNSKNNRAPLYNWDDHAAEFERLYSRSDYRDKLLSKVIVGRGDTVLDVGCGPGNLTVPLASRAGGVTALDSSIEMLRLGEKEAKAKNISNTVFKQLDWNEAVIWKNVQPHDIVICSRSFPNQHPKESLVKLDRAAKSRVYLTLRTAADEATAFFQNLYQAIGKEYRAYPEYMYGYNLLHQLGILAHVDYIDYTDTFRYEGAEAAYAVLTDHMNIETSAQKEKVMYYITRNMGKNNGIFSLDIKVKWALLWWGK